LRRPVFIDNDANMEAVGGLKYRRTNDKSAGVENWMFHETSVIPVELKVQISNPTRTPP
jgi:hypothetical protein